MDHDEDEGSARRRPNLGDLAQVFTFAGLTSYAAAWLFAAFMFSRFGVQPEEVGADLEFLLVRASVLAGTITALVALIALLSVGGWLTRGRRGDLRVFNGVVVVASITFLTLCISFGAIGVTYTLAPAVQPWQSTLIVIPPAVVLTGAQLMLLLRSVHMRARIPYGASLGPVSYTHLGGLVACWLLVLLPGSALAGTAVGRSVADGTPVEWPILNVPVVDVRAVPGTMPATNILPSCALELGSSGNEVVLYDSATGVTFKVARENVTTAVRQRKCANTEDEL